MEAPGWCGHGSRFTYSAEKDAWEEYDMRQRRITCVWNRYKGKRVPMGQYEPVVARYIRVEPMAWHGLPTMRCGFIARPASTEQTAPQAPSEEEIER